MQPLDRVVAVLLAPLVLLAALRLVPLDESFPLVALEAEIAWLMVPAWLALGWAVLRRSRALAAMAMLPVGVHAFLLVTAVGGAVTWFPRDGVSMRIVAANVLAWNERSEELARELAGTDADVMTITELTPEWVAVLEREGVLAQFPHRVIVPRDDCFGIALLSRPPIVEHEVVDLGGVPMITAVLALDGRRVRVNAVHTLPPRERAYTTVWRAQMIALRARIDPRESTIVAGDLNASPFARSYRALLSAGLRGAHESVGRGLAPTWPNGLMPVPPMRLDHVLVTGSIDVLEVREGVGAGSDHRPVIADLSIAG
ncbi:MAG: endonuclease/exonuclease/phosphatase family protein [Myxococcota bacterium]|nr:endonuclease/exonuclease/phosphatase family protein [Myxococcota bacterium]